MLDKFQSQNDYPERGGRMSQLPYQKELPINLLAACFNNTTATYKYYWLLSILELIETGNLTISKRELFAKMISKAWFTVNYFHVSFGKQDLIQQAIHALNKVEKIPIDGKYQFVFEKLSTSCKAETLNLLWHFDKNVPHWFLSPWFPQMDRAEIHKASQSFNKKCMYGLFKNDIKINPEWKDYLTENVRVLKDFCYWNLALFLQAKNPNVPDIPNKLFKPAVRNSLVNQKNKYWKNVFDKEGSIECIFTKEKLMYESENFAIDHFVPHGFVSHDLIWNLIPIDKRFNCVKSDKLPSIKKHFDSFFEVQKIAFEINYKLNPKSKFMEEFLSIFPDLDTSFTKEKFKERIQPLITIASNNGFEFLK